MYTTISILSTVLSVAVAQSNFVCYFPNWTRYRPGIANFSTAHIDPTKCTHLIYAFAVLEPTSYTLKIFDSWADIDLGGYASAVALKKVNPKLKVSIAIGGWTDSQDTDKYSKLVASPTLISNFVSSAVAFLKKYGFDGLDIDWEYPGKVATDKAGFTALVKALKSAFQTNGFLLSAAVPAATSALDTGYDLPQVAQYVDFLNLMAYDMHGSWDGSLADHHAPLYKRPFEQDGNNIDYVIRYFASKGFPLSKIMLGIPLYGRGWTLSGTTTSIPAPANGGSPAGPYTLAVGSLAYYEVCLLLRSGYTKVSDPAKLNGPYIYNLAARTWVGYDDTDMAVYKVSYLKQKGLGGAMVWDISQDDFTNACGGGANPMITAIWNAINSATVIPTVAPATTTKAPATTTTAKAPTTTTKATTPTTTKASATTKSSATTLKPAATTTKSTSFTCPGSGLYPDPTTCTKYYSCANGIAYSMPCGSGLYFNPTIKVCDWPYNVPSCKGK